MSPFYLAKTWLEVLTKDTAHIFLFGWCFAGGDRFADAVEL